jgi:hypothetical protein
MGRLTARLSAIRISSRSARLTEPESGKVLATSGASRTVVPRELFRPGPRATTRIERKSYSARRSSPCFDLDAFFISLAFAAGRLPGVDDPNRIASFGVSHQPIVIGVVANPVPYDAASPHDRERAIIETDPGRVDVVLTFQFLELQTGMRRVCPKKAISPLSAQRPARDRVLTTIPNSPPRRAASCAELVESLPLDIGR